MISAIINEVKPTLDRYIYRRKYMLNKLGRLLIDHRNNTNMIIICVKKNHDAKSESIGWLQLLQPKKKIGDAFIDAPLDWNVRAKFSKKKHEI